MHIVAAQPQFLVGKARIGFHQIRSTGGRVDFKQAVIRQHRVWPDDTDRVVTGCHFKALARQRLHRLTVVHGLLPGRTGDGIHFTGHRARFADGHIGCG